MESDLVLILCHEIVDRVNDVFWHGSSSSIVARNVTGVGRKKKQLCSVTEEKQEI